MYLAELNIWNFRKYGIKGDSFETSKPGVSIQFSKGLNVLIGENDSGKTTIIDAIRFRVVNGSTSMKPTFIQRVAKEFRI